MEFPDIGANCAFSGCNRLDFLPVKCAGCHRLFCKDHYSYAQHHCTTPGIQDKQVPVCPLCSTPVPIRPGELPDERVGQHIDSACKSKPALELKGKIFPNVCSLPKCKKREAVTCACSRCGLNFCLTHRNELDHDCQGPQGRAPGRRISAAGAAAIFRAVFRNQPTRNQRNNGNTQPPQSTNSNQRDTSEDYARALQEEEDRRLAFALSASLNPTATRSAVNSTESRDRSCRLS